ncbi:hypothetical protein B0H17DRAFT_1148483 [Mycena rosella]|uniref:Uncharacterized protein n=1 Tax=Mycena rosella TaxID=1033263 RepID=A0AAD7CCP2_MYCRO|nr:hypothetical protein B0H17DRAFT_1148483 [Mycena rosella]
MWTLRFLSFCAWTAVHINIPIYIDTCQDLALWNMRTICLCGRPWAAHDRPSQLSLSRSHESEVLSIPTSSSGALISPQRPALAYAGISRRPTAATVQQERQASIYRTLPQYQSSAGPSSAPVNPRSNKRLSGPPRPYSSGSAATLADFSAAPSEPPKVKITVGILPKVLNTSDQNDFLDLSPHYLWKGGDDLELAQRQLQLANLTFTVLVPPSGPNIDFVAPTPASTNGVIYTTPNTLPWILLGPKGRVPNRTWVEDPKCLTPFTFAVPALRASPYSGTSNFIEEGIFIFVAPEVNFHFVSQLPASEIYVDSSIVFLTLLTDDRIMFSLTNASLAVSFIPFSAHLATIRVQLVALRALAILLVLLGYIDLTCPLRELDSDDSDDDVHLVVDGLQPLTVTQIPLSPSQACSCVFCATSLRSHPICTDIDLCPSPSYMDGTPISVKARSFIPGGPIDLTLRSLPGAGPFSLFSWQDHMAEIHRPDSDVISIEAPTVDCAAQALIIYCIWLHCVRQPPEVKLKEILQEQFHSPRPTVSGPFTNVALFAARIKIGPGFGKGPRAEVLGCAVEILMCDGLYWTDCGEYKTLRLHPSLSPIPRRSALLKASGLIEYQYLVNIPGMDVGLLFPFYHQQRSPSQYAALRVPDGRSGDTIRTVVPWSGIV